MAVRGLADELGGIPPDWAVQSGPRGQELLAAQGHRQVVRGGQPAGDVPDKVEVKLSWPRKTLSLRDGFKRVPRAERKPGVLIQRGAVLAECDLPASPGIEVAVLVAHHAAHSEALAQASDVCSRQGSRHECKRLARCRTVGGAGVMPTPQPEKLKVGPVALQHLSGEERRCGRHVRHAAVVDAHDLATCWWMLPEQCEQE